MDELGPQPGRGGHGGHVGIYQRGVGKGWNREGNVTISLGLLGHMGRFGDQHKQDGRGPLGIVEGSWV